VNKDFHREFTKCPVCRLREELAEILGKPELATGSGEDRFLEQLGNEMKERGLAREEWNFHLDVKQGVVLDQTKAAAIPIGSEVPGYGFMTDICMDCGCVYSVDITRTEIKKPPPPLAQPNRAQRRRMERDGGPPPINPINLS